MYKKKILILTFSVLIYILLLFIFNKVKSGNFKEVYILSKDLERGEKISNENLSKIKVEDSIFGVKYVDNVDNLVASSSLKASQLLTYDIVMEEEEYLKINDKNKEIISINLSDLDINASYNMSVGSIVNVYYTGRSSQLENNLQSIGSDKIKSSSITDGYTTVLLLKDAQVKQLFDKNGNVINNKDRSTSSLVTTINIEVESDIAILIENIKNYGKFSITLKR